MPNSRFDVPRYLSVLAQFKTLGPAQLRRLAEGCQLRQVSRGQSVFRVGEPCEDFNIAVTGLVKLFALSAAGQEKVIELVGPGVSFAEATMFIGGPHRVNAQALADTLLLVVSRQAVLTEVAHDPCFALQMLNGLSLRLNELVDDVEAYALHSGLRRVVDYLLRELGGLSAAAATVSLPASKATIAMRLSLTPEYFSRVLHRLEAAGLIRIDKRAIRIHDPARLRQYRDPADGLAPCAASPWRTPPSGVAHRMPAQATAA